MWQEILSFHVAGRPQQRGSKVPIRLKNGRTVVKDSNEKSVEWMRIVTQQAADAWGARELLREPVALSFRFFFARPQSHYGTGRNSGKLKPSAPAFHAQSPDLAKLIRAAEDALTGIVYQDDKLVVAYLTPTARYWTEGAEGAEITVFVDVPDDTATM